jgi:hypothetical protein
MPRSATGHPHRRSSCRHYPRGRLRYADRLHRPRWRYRQLSTNIPPGPLNAGRSYSDKGRPGIETRFVIGLLLRKHIYGLSDEGVCERWVHDPYFQYFTGEEFFQHEFPHERSDLSHWRKRLGDKLELLLAESLRVAHASGALRMKDLARVTVDTTVQPKAITFPTDAKLLHAAIKGLNRLPVGMGCGCGNPICASPSRRR